MRYFRTSAFHPRVAGAILRRIAEGEALTTICGPGRAPGMPETMTVYKWLNRYPQFREAYEIARLAQFELFADEALAIADGRNPVAGETRALQRDRLRVNARRWRMKVMRPRARGQAWAPDGLYLPENVLFDLAGGGAG